MWLLLERLEEELLRLVPGHDELLVQFLREGRRSLLVAVVSSILPTHGRESGVEFKLIVLVEGELQLLLLHAEQTVFLFVRLSLMFEMSSSLVN
mmetsp:Transcript_35090/g.64571  ORF Transcript_35090/g.64571 Transcript_35090/m.64571 type:complete len:94 (-) Transcript_35090:8-289(-)